MVNRSFARSLALRYIPTYVIASYGTNRRVALVVRWRGLGEAESLGGGWWEVGGRGERGRGGSWACVEGVGRELGRELGQRVAVGGREGVRCG